MCVCVCVCLMSLNIVQAILINPGQFYQITFLTFLSLLRRRVWFETSFPSLSLSLQGYRLLIGHHGKVKGIGIIFRGFLCGKVLCPDHSCFYFCLDLIVLDSTLRIYFCPGREREAPSLAVCSKMDVRRHRDMYRR